MSAPFRRRWLLAVGAGTAISLVACGAVETNESPASAVTDPARATAALRSTPIVTTNLPAPREAPVEATIPLVGTPTLAWADEQYVWIGGLEGYSRIDPDTNEVTATVDAAGAIHVVTGFESVWTPDFAAGKVRRFDVETGELQAEIEGFSNPEGITVSAEGVWVANHRGGSVSQIDPATNTVDEPIVVGPIGRSGPSELAVDEDTLWVSVPNLPGVVAVDLATNAKSDEIPVNWPASPCGRPTSIGAEIWVSSCPDAPSTVADPASGATSMFDLGGAVGPFFEVGGLVWMTVVPMDGSEPYVAGVDPETLLAVDAVALPSPGLATTTGFGSLWVVTEDPPQVTRISLDAFEGS